MCLTWHSSSSPLPVPLKDERGRHKFGSVVSLRCWWLKPVRKTSFGETSLGWSSRRGYLACWSLPLCFPRQVRLIKHPKTPIFHFEISREKSSNMHRLPLWFKTKAALLETWRVFNLFSGILYFFKTADDCWKQGKKQYINQLFRFEYGSSMKTVVSFISKCWFSRNKAKKYVVKLVMMHFRDNPDGFESV